MQGWTGGTMEGRKAGQRKDGPVEGWHGDMSFWQIYEIFFPSYINYNIYKIILYKKVIE
jgi:hypothetical protein